MSTEVKEKFDNFIEEHKLSIECVFIPYSKSRNFKPNAKTNEKSW